MHTPPDPNGRPQPAHPPAGPGDSSGSPDAGRGSTNSHPTTPPSAEPPLSDLIHRGSSSSRKVPSAADIAQMLGPPGASPLPMLPIAENTDDAPTIITQNKALSSHPTSPPPPYIVGEAPSVAGRRLGHFELIESIGSGGMAAVLKARDLELGRVVALKILPPEAARDPENVTRFKQEARAAAKLDHENVARVYFCGEDQGLHFIAFEFVEGITLRQMIDRRGTVPPAECVRYMIQVSAGLNHAAERHVVHRDIKPSNIIITPDGRAKIVDMGLARHLDSPSVNGGVTQSGVTLGTFDYISPEQALDPRRADVRSDIYSLGCAFYHALTGRPPTPEGTAAKKLHAHQHIAPLDPRTLNPAIPDELAAVLARMMAKDPERRYQTPAELIAHLKGVAEKLRLPADAVSADSVVRAVAADPNVFPEPPRLPLGWILAAVAAGVAVVALVIANSDRGSGRAAPDQAGSTGKQDPAPPPKNGGPTTPTPGNPDRGTEVATARELAEALAKPETTKVRLLPGETYDLTKLSRPVVFTGKQIEMAGSPERPPPRVIFAAGTLTLKAEAVALSGIRFEVVPAPDADLFGFSAPTSSAHGLLIPDAGHVHLTDCVFTPDERTTRKGLATVALGRIADGVTTVTLTRCVFAPGWVGLQVPAHAKVAIDDSGFGPHAAAIRVNGDELGSTAEIAIERSSFMLDPGAVAVDAEGASAKVTAGYCVFAPANGRAGESVGQYAAVVRGDAGFENVEYAAMMGRRNAYYRVDPLGTSEQTFTFEQCRTQQLPATDREAVKLRQRPWDAAEGGVLVPFASPDPYRAFRLKLDDPDIFAMRQPVLLFGALFHRDNVRLAYDPAKSWPPSPPPVLLAADIKEKVWCPNAPNEATLPRGHYIDLVKLLRDARTGDTILIEGTGLVEVPKAEIQAPTRPDRGDFKLTFKPAPGSHPVLVCSPHNDELDAALFRIRDGEIEFQNLSFLVKPGERASLTAVSVLRGKKCTFTKCVFTLEEESKAAAVVTLSDPGRKMVMNPVAVRPVPEVRFEDCLIRGKGRGVWVSDGQPFELSVNNSVTAVYGPLLLVNGAGKDVGGSPRPSVVRFSRTTLLLGGPVVEVHAGRVGEMRGPGLASVDLTAEGCLFAAVPGAGRPLVELTGVDPEEVKRAADNSPLRWSATKGNRYANFDSSSPAMMARQGNGDPEKKWDWNQWVGFAGEPADRGPLGKVIFAEGPAGVQDLAHIGPADLELKMVEFPDLTDPAAVDFGANPKSVARPPDDE